MNNCVRSLCSLGPLLELECSLSKTEGDKQGSKRGGRVLDSDAHGGETDLGLSLESNMSA